MMAAYALLELRKLCLLLVFEFSVIVWFSHVVELFFSFVFK